MTLNLKPADVTAQAYSMVDGEWQPVSIEESRRVVESGIGAIKLEGVWDIATDDYRHMSNIQCNGGFCNLTLNGGSEHNRVRIGSAAK